MKGLFFGIWGKFLFASGSGGGALLTRGRLAVPSRSIMVSAPFGGKFVKKEWIKPLTVACVGIFRGPYWCLGRHSSPCVFDPWFPSQSYPYHQDATTHGVQSKVATLALARAFFNRIQPFSSAALSLDDCSLVSLYRVFARRPLRSRREPSSRSTTPVWPWTSTRISACAMRWLSSRRSVCATRSLGLSPISWSASRGGLCEESRSSCRKRSGRGVWTLCPRYVW